MWWGENEERNKGGVEGREGGRMRGGGRGSYERYVGGMVGYVGIKYGKGGDGRRVELRKVCCKKWGQKVNM